MIQGEYMAAAQGDFKYEIINELGVLSENKGGWRRVPCLSLGAIIPAYFL